MESPNEAKEMAYPIVLQAVWGDRQLLLSLPLTPSTYQVALAAARGHGNEKTWQQQPDEYQRARIHDFASLLNRLGMRFITLI